MAKRPDDQLYALPETTALAGGVKHKLDTLLREAHSLKGIEKRLREIKTEITDLIERNGLRGDDGTLGVRMGGQCAIVRWNNGRRTIDREMLLAWDVPEETIENATKTGAGYWAVELPVIGVDSE